MTREETAARALEGRARAFAGSGEERELARALRSGELVIVPADLVLPPATIERDDEPAGRAVAV